MKKWISRIIVVMLLLGAFAGIGMFAYHIGYQQGVQGTGAGSSFMLGHSGRFNQEPQFKQDDTQQFHPGMSRGFDHRSMPGFGDNRFNTMNRGRSFGFFSPFRFLFSIAFLGLVIWLGYKLFKGNGWQLSLTRQSTQEAAKPETENVTETESEG